MAQKFDARQTISRDVLSQLLGINGTELDDLLRAINKEFNAPLRMSATFPTADSKLNFQASEIEAADLAGDSIGPIATSIPSFVATTIDFQTAAITGGTVSITFPNSTVGFYRRVGFSLRKDSTLEAVFSAESGTLGGLAAPGTLFIEGAIPIGWIDLEATATSPGRFKTAGSSTNIIENKVSSSQRIHRIESLTYNQQEIQFSVANDAATGSATLSTPTTGIVRLTSGSLTSITGIPALSSGRFLLIENKTGNTIFVNNEDATATAANRIQTGTSSNVSMPNNATFMFTYDSTASRWQLTGGSGSGSGSGGSKNYLSAVITSQSTSPNTGNGNFEAGSTSGWSLFNTTLTSLIPTGSITAGAASITTFNTVSSSQLAGSYSLQTASSAAWSAGQGFISDAFYIDNEDQNKILTFKAYYKAVANPSNGNFSGTSSNTFAIYIYDVTNSAWIQPAGVYGLNQNSGIGYVTGTFQTTSNSTQYRIAVLAINASSGAITMYWDDFSVGPQVSPIGVAAQDVKSYTPTWTGLGTVSSTTVYYRREGDSLVGWGFVGAGTTAASSMTMTLPGLSVDTNKISNNAIVGKMSANATPFSGGVLSLTASPTVLNFTSDGASYANGVNGNTWGNSTSFSFEFKVPIAGWSSNVVMSNDTDTRVISAFYNGQPTGTLSGADNLITIPTKVIDVASGMSSGTYTVPIAGKYSVTAQIGLNTTSATANQYFTLSIKQNGTLRAENVIRAEASSIDSRNAQVHAELDCIAGDTITLTSNTNMTSVTYNATAARSYVRIERLSGPSTIAASESINATATTSTTAIASVATTTVVFSTVSFDTHGSYSTTTGKFTAPISGKYEISGAAYSSNTGANGVSTEFRLIANQSGSISKTMTVGRQVVQTTSAIGMGLNGSATFNCLAGDQLWFTIFNGGGSTITLNNAAADNFICIKRVGN